MGALTKNNNIKISFLDYLYPVKLGEKLGKMNAELDMEEKENEIKVTTEKTTPQKRKK